MNVYKCTDFEGHWPVGSAAVVVADNVVEAAHSLEVKLSQIGLSQKIDTSMLSAINTREPSVHILNSGDY